VTARLLLALPLLVACPAGDADGDGHEAPADCDDSDPAVYPGAAELCGDGIDQDCEPGPGDCRYDGVASAADLASLIPFDSERSDAGAALATGDFDGDGWPDAAVGVPGLDAGASDAGGVWLLFGGPEGFVRTATLPWGVRDARAGAALAVGDFDGDGQDDLAVGAPGSEPIFEGTDESTGFGAGAVIVARGPLAEGPLTGSLWAGRDPGDCAGSALSVADLDDDGADELLAGAPCRGAARALDPPTGLWVLGYGAGEAYGLLDPLAGGALADADVRWPGGEAWERAGAAVAQAGDAVLVGAPNYFGAEWIHPAARGRVRAFPRSGRGEVVAATATSDFVGNCCGAERFDSIGTAVHPVGGGALLGAPGLNDFAVLGGAFYFDAVPSGEVSAWDGVILAAPPVPGSDTEAGSVLGSADLDCDGVVDLIVAAPRTAGGAEESGGLFVAFDSPTGFVELADAAFELQGTRTDERLGSALATADFDGDGCDDIIIGAEGHGAGGHRAGAVWLLRGRGP